MPSARRLVNLHRVCSSCVLFLLVFQSGCGSPDHANIVLRKKEQDLSAKADALTRQHEADTQLIRGLRERTGTLQTLSSKRLDRLYFTHALKLGRLTGGADLDRQRPGDEGLKIYVSPLDQDGETIKAAGSFTIQAYDLSRNDHPRIGEWNFDLAQSRQAWRGAMMHHGYVLTCPWQTAPAKSPIHIEITFVDELTQTPFHQTVDVKVDLGDGKSDSAADSNQMHADDSATDFNPAHTDNGEKNKR